MTKPALLLAAGAALAALACNTLPDVPPGTSGPEMYRLLGCAECHGERGEGNVQGPPLRELRAHWNSERDLAEYLRDPAPFQESVPRVRWLHDRYSWDMPRYWKLSLEQRLEFAAWLFTLG